MLLTESPKRLRDAAPDAAGIARFRSVRSLYSPEQLSWVIRRERARADRNRAALTIVNFKLDEAAAAGRERWRLAHAMVTVLRETDELGWFDEATLCCVLPDTAAAGADTLIARLSAALRGRPIRAEIGVYADRLADEPLPDLQSSRLQASAGRIAPTPPTKAASIDDLLAEPLPWWKRCLDIVASSTLIIAASPLLIGAAVAIKLSSPGPAIFRQQRTGLGGRPFTIFKFRTMRLNAEKEQASLRAASLQDGPAFKMERDPRVFAVGSFLRKTSIDELPQLFNVLRGEMTLVGPRPLPVGEAEACIGWQARRHDVTPGLTCIWQVEGRSRVKFDEWMRMDRRYARRRSLAGDLWLVMRTVPAVLMRRGAK